MSINFAEFIVRDLLRILVRALVSALERALEKALEKALYREYLWSIYIDMLHVTC